MKAGERRCQISEPTNQSLLAAPGVCNEGPAVRLRATDVWWGCSGQHRPAQHLLARARYRSVYHTDENVPEPTRRWCTILHQASGTVYFGSTTEPKVRGSNPLGRATKAPLAGVFCFSRLSRQTRLSTRTSCGVRELRCASRSRRSYPRKYHTERDVPERPDGGVRSSSKPAELLLRTDREQNRR
jgi:hypothetical protein